MLGDSPIVWSSRLQTAVSTSTVEAEYLALRPAIKDIMWLRHLLADLGYGVPKHRLSVEVPRAILAQEACMKRKMRVLDTLRHIQKRARTFLVGIGNIRCPP